MLLLVTMTAAGCAQDKPPVAFPPASARAAGSIAGDHRLTATVDGTARAYVLHAPPGYPATTAVPLVIACTTVPARRRPCAR